MAPVAEQLNPLAGYEQLFGSKKVFIGELVGPTLYAAGGVTFNASQLGWGGLELLQGSMSVSGTYYVRVQYLPIVAAPSTFQGAVPTVKIVWIVTATGAEAAAIDLSGEIIRIHAIGV